MKKLALMVSIFTLCFGLSHPSAAQAELELDNATLDAIIDLLDSASVDKIWTCDCKYGCPNCKLESGHGATSPSNPDGTTCITSTSQPGVLINCKEKKPAPTGGGTAGHHEVF
ncbi:MAG: hypothetical protein KDD66_03265 [Bdellovibrionales bacterium]|nr:hypothetical protein [Bdellovibrionales bacterium]